MLRKVESLGSLVFGDMVMILLALLSVVLLIYEVASVSLTASQTGLVQKIDLAIALFFLAEFIHDFLKAPAKKDFLKKYWWELLAAIPITNHTTQFLRSLNLIRIFPLVETIRFARLAVRLRMVIDASKKITHQAYLVYVVVMVGLIITAGAFGFNYFEYGTNPHVKSFWDSFWWAIVTTSTIGYGDIYPVTVGGRIIAILLILVGIGSLGIFIAVIDTYVIKRIFLTKNIPVKEENFKF